MSPSPGGGVLGCTAWGSRRGVDQLLLALPDPWARLMLT